MNRIGWGFGIAAALMAALPRVVPAQVYSPAPAATAPAVPAAPVRPALPPLQTPASPGTPAAPQPPTAQTQSQVQAATEQRISGLLAQLAITPAEMPQWNAVAQVMRDNARETDMLFRQRAETVRDMTAVANLQSYAAISRAYGDGTEKLASAFKALYDALSDQQKQAADTLFRQQATQSAQAAVK